MGLIVILVVLSAVVGVYLAGAALVVGSLHVLADSLRDDDDK